MPEPTLPTLPSIRDSPHGATFRVRVQPRARFTKITGLFGSDAACALKVAVTAPAVEGQANAALLRFLAEYLQLPLSSLTVLSGEHARIKTVRAAQISADELRRRLGA